jgi:hypothetical protein
MTAIMNVISHQQCAEIILLKQGSSVMMAIPEMVTAVTRTVNSNRQEALVRIMCTVMDKSPAMGEAPAGRVPQLTVMMGWIVRRIPVMKIIEPV